MMPPGPITLTQKEYVAIINSLLYVLITGMNSGRILDTETKTLLRMYNMYCNYFGRDEYYNTVDKIMEKELPHL